MLKLEALHANLLAPNLAPRTPAYTYFYNRMPMTPDFAILLAEVAGMPVEMQTEVDNPGVQILVRSPVDQPIVARDVAHEIDRIMLNDALFPLDLGGTHTWAAGRMGGAPGYLDTDEQRRTLYSCSYWISLKR